MYWLLRRIKGADDASNEETMFSNSTFSLEFNTLSTEEIVDINVGCLSDCGFCFLWVIKSQIPFGFECLNRWGYTFVDMVRPRSGNRFTCWCLDYRLRGWKRPQTTTLPFRRVIISFIPQISAWLEWNVQKGRDWNTSLGSTTILCLPRWGERHRSLMNCIKSLNWWSLVTQDVGIVRLIWA